ncbi:MAG: von Willebrand factor type A domain-containing protein, partial [Eubacteriales bacterium]|nr:von Willebrand factor type A domain-containing protein [Eubacteriales bacterium]
DRIIHYDRKGVFAMKTMEQIIKEKGREQFYTYYTSLGYDHRTAAALALFTYGRYSYKEFSMADLYDALSRNREYLPPEIQDFSEELEFRRALPTGYGGSAPGSSKKYSFAKAASAPPAKKSGPAARTSRKSSAPSGKHEQGLFPRFLSSMRSSGNADSFSGGIAYNEEADACEAPSFGLSESPMQGRPDIMGFAGAAGYATDEYERIEEKDARSTVAEATSTFRMTTNTASAGVIFNQLRNSRRIDRSMVRIEEMLNYFRYESEIPAEEMFNISYELMDSGNDRKYLYINVQGREEVKDRQNIIILLDVSGSMSRNAEQTQAIIATIVSKLGNGDKLSLVTYSTRDRVELDSFTVNGPEDRIRVMEKLLSIEISGCTYGSAGIERAYEIGKKNYIPGGNNQVILITDGDLNFGITDKGGLEELIELKKKDNLFLSVIGTGLYNYKDDKLETLSKHGNGVYRTVNSLTDVKKSIDEEYASLVNIIAKDVKAQVEFNPEVVESYRLLGFENRTLAREDFANDKVISEPFGSGGYGVALYELKMKTGNTPVESGLKYSRLITTGSPETGTVKVRYKEPLESVSHELEKVIESSEASCTDNLRLAFIVYVCSEKLRGSDKISDEEIALAKKLYTELGSSIREKNAADLYKLAGILDQSVEELGIGIRKKPFPW